MSDRRLALRRLLRHPAFSVVAVLTQALGMRAATTLFGGLLLRPLPF